MDITDLQAFLAGEADTFVQYTVPLTEPEFAYRPNGRWSAGDTAQHLYLSARPVLRLLAGPREVFAQWGYAEGPSQSYEVVRELYRQALGKGMKAPANFSPGPDDAPDDKATVLARLVDAYLGVAAQLAGWSDDEMDRYRMPHPALGLITVREMVQFIGVHTRHHIAILQAY